MKSIDSYILQGWNATFIPEDPELHKALLTQDDGSSLEQAAAIGIEGFEFLFVELAGV